MTIMAKPYVESVCGGEVEEVSVCLPPPIYHTLYTRRAEIGAAGTAHLLWDTDASSILLLGSSESVQQTAQLLGQLVSGGRKLLANSSSGQFSQFSGLPACPLPPPSAPAAARLQLGRTLSDSQAMDNKTAFPYNLLNNNSNELCVLPRRKLEPEDSSYGSDQEVSSSTNLLSARSHEDISRSDSETLGQEFAEYVTIRSSGSCGRGRPAGASRDASPTPATASAQQLADRLEAVQENPSSSTVPSQMRHSSSSTFGEGGSSGGGTDLSRIVQDPAYNSKVEFALKLGYSESLLQKALLKVGLAAQQNELLDELIRLQHIRAVDPKDLLLQEAQEMLLSRQPSLGGDSPLHAAFKKQHEADNLRPIVIDGSNVAMSHGNKEKFSCLGIKICVQWFQARGHKEITVFVPAWRKESSKPESPTTAQHILGELERDRLLTFTPSRQVGGRRVVCLDDRYILKLAADTDAVVVSNDNFRELINEKPEYKKVIEERILMYSFVNDKFMPPDDPLGRNGPTLDNFLRKSLLPSDLPQACPYGKKCTYGNKCKFYHADRGNAPHKSITDKLKEQSSRKILQVRTRNTSRDSSPGQDLARTQSMNLLQLHRTESDIAMFARPKQPVTRTRSSRPAVSVPDGSSNSSSGLLYPDMAKKVDIVKSMSTDTTGRLRPLSDWRGAAGAGSLEIGCLNNFGMSSAVRPQSTAGPWNTPSPQTAAAAAAFSAPPPLASHRPLERQLTINPTYDPRINKPLKSSQQSMFYSAAMEYMHRNPPPPLGMAPQQQQHHHQRQSHDHHQNVTRISSAPDSIRLWGAAAAVGGNSGSGVGLSAASSLPVAIVEPLGMDLLAAAAAGVSAAGNRSPIQRRHNSTSDSQLNRSSPTAALDHFSSDTWKYDSGISPILSASPVGVSGSCSSNNTATGNIWGPPPPTMVPPSSLTPPPRESPPPSPLNLGPVGSSRPGRGQQQDTRSQLKYHLSALFPVDQVEEVMNLMPEETNPKSLCAAIMKMYPPS